MRPAQNQKKSIQQELDNKLIFFIYAPILLFFIIIMVLMWGVSTSQLANIHKSLTVVIEQSVREQLNAPVAVLENILDDFKDTGDRTDSVDIIDRIMLHSRAINDIYILDPSGTVEYANSEKSGLIGLDYSNYPFYRELQKGRDRWFQPVISSITSTVYYTIALKDDDGRIFVCVYTISDLQSLVERLSGLTDSRIAVLNKDRYFLAHTDYNEVRERHQEVDFDSTGAYRILKKDGQRFIFRWSYLADLGLYVVIYKGVLDLYNPLILSVAGFIMLLGGLFLMVRQFSRNLVGRLMRDLNALLSGSDQISMGNYLIRVEHSEYSELDRLADSFNIMASTLDSVVRDLSDSKNEVLKVNEYLKDQYSLTKARERELQLVMENSYDGIVLLNPDFAIIRISSAALKLFHQPVQKDRYQGESLSGILDNQIRDEVLEQLKGSADSGTMTFRNYRWSGKLYEIISIPVISEENLPMGLIVSFRDVTEKSEMEERLFRARKLESIGRLASGVAHDFNNIIQAVSGLVSVLEDCEDPVERKAYLESINGTVDTARNLVRQLMDFYRGESGAREALYLNAVVADQAKMLDQLIGKGIQLVTDSAESSPRIYAVRNRIEQIIINLVVNARDAMGMTGRIEIRTDEILREGQRFAVLEIVDYGSGIRDEDRERIFDPFYSTKEPGSGTGLGLSTVFSIVDDMNGKIEVDSTVGTGTTFRILLPESDV